MNSTDSVGLICPLPIGDHERVQMAHGGGGGLTNRLINECVLTGYGSAGLSSEHDGASVVMGGRRLAFTTDSFVVKPYRFAGGDVGSLAVNGTVNDLAMCGARPEYLSVALILEEGLLIDDLRHIMASMGQSAVAAGVYLVTGDTKVVDKGSGDGIFITTSGIGTLASDVSIGPDQVRAGDSIILSNDIARHGMAIMSDREGLAFTTTITSDTCSLANAVDDLLQQVPSVHCLRDPTRGGLATSLVEIASTSSCDIEIDELKIPIREDVRHACDTLGFDPLYVANEGCFITFVPEPLASKTVSVLRARAECANAVAIGTVVGEGAGVVTARTPIGGQRVLDLPSGEQLPRIC